MDDYAAENQKLLDRFARALSEHDTDAWFDEDELLDIFDYAGDTGNDYLRAEALMWGARYFPDSELLRERRAVFYADFLGDNVVKAYTADNNNGHDQPSLLTTIISARAEGLDKHKARRRLDKIVSSCEQIDDEEIIQLVGFAAETGNLDWLHKNLNTLKAKVIYQPALLYEVAAEFFDAGNYAQAIPVLEDLVNEMPYNEEYWALLADAQWRSGSPGANDNALESAEMALAINPHSRQAISVKGNIMSASGNIEALIALYNENPDVTDLATALVHALWPQVATDETVRKQCIDLCLGIIEHEPTNETIITALLFLGAPQAPAVLSKYRQQTYNANNPDTPIVSWTDWAYQLLTHKCPQGAITILDTLTHDDADWLTDAENNDNAARILLIYMESYMRLKDFAAVDCYYNLALRNNTPLTAMQHYLEVMALVNLEQYSRALQCISNFDKACRKSFDDASANFDDYNPMFDTTFAITCKWVTNELTGIAALITAGKTSNLKTIDPLGLWH